MVTYTCGAVTDRGDVRKENQDSILYLTGNICGEPAAFAVLADGMGGLSYGAEVSRYITEQFKRWWYEDFPDMVREGMEKEEDIRELLEQEIWDINQAVLAFKNKKQCRTGSTLSLLLFFKEQYFIENIGDSRIYLLQSGRLERLTTDQSVEEQKKQNPDMKMDEAQYRRMKNRLTMCIGMFQIPQSQYSFGKVKTGDLFLVCSDGLYKMIKIERMEEILADSGQTVGQKVERLRKEIGPGQALDNVSVILTEIN